MMSSMKMSMMSKYCFSLLLLGYLILCNLVIDCLVKVIGLMCCLFWLVGLWWECFLWIGVFVSLCFGLGLVDLVVDVVVGFLLVVLVFLCMGLLWWVGLLVEFFLCIGWEEWVDVVIFFVFLSWLGLLMIMFLGLVLLGVLLMMLFGVVNFLVFGLMMLYLLVFGSLLDVSFLFFGDSLFLMEGLFLLLSFCFLLVMLFFWVLFDGWCCGLGFCYGCVLGMCFVYVFCSVWGIWIFNLWFWSLLFC